MQNQVFPQEPKLCCRTSTLADAGPWLVSGVIAMVYGSDHRPDSNTILKSLLESGGLTRTDSHARLYNGAPRG